MAHVLPLMIPLAYSMLASRQGWLMSPRRGVTRGQKSKGSGGNMGGACARSPGVKKKRRRTRITSMARDLLRGTWQTVHFQHPVSSWWPIQDNNYLFHQTFFSFLMKLQSAFDAKFSLHWNHNVFVFLLGSAAWFESLYDHMPFHFMNASCLTHVNSPPYLQFLQASFSVYRLCPPSLLTPKYLQLPFSFASLKTTYFLMFTFCSSSMFMLLFRQQAISHIVSNNYALHIHFSAEKPYFEFTNWRTFVLNKKIALQKFQFVSEFI